MRDNRQCRVASARVHKEVGVLLLRVGDFCTESQLLDPLAKSILHYLRLLLPDDMLDCCELRSMAELHTLWEKRHAAHSHVILVGHGDRCALKFGVDGAVAPGALVKLLGKPAGGRQKTVLSLCCETGFADFARVVSNSVAIAALIAPFGVVHGAVASQFVQTYFAYHFLQGETPQVAFRHARDGVPGAVSFRLWRKGKLAVGAK
jgi:hypothetical protein